MDREDFLNPAAFVSEDEIRSCVSEIMDATNHYDAHVVVAAVLFMAKSYSKLVDTMLEHNCGTTETAN